MAYADAIGEFALPQDVDAVFTCLAGNATTIGLEEWVLFAAKLKTAWDYNSTPATPVSPVASRSHSSSSCCDFMRLTSWQFCLGQCSHVKGL